MNIALVAQNYPTNVPKQEQSKPSPTSYVGAQPTSAQAVADANQRSAAAAAMSLGMEFLAHDHCVPPVCAFAVLAATRTSVPAACGRPQAH